MNVCYKKDEFYPKEEQWLCISFMDTLWITYLKDGMAVDIYVNYRNKGWEKDFELNDLANERAYYIWDEINESVVIIKIWKTKQELMEEMFVELM